MLNDATFWKQKTYAIKNADDVFEFVLSYLPSLGVGYEAAVVDALEELLSVKKRFTEDESVQKLLQIIELLRAEPENESRYKHLTAISKLVNYKLPSMKTIYASPDLSSYDKIVDYVSYLLDSLDKNLWPDMNIAYSIVGIAGVYDIKETDGVLYEIWDLATELEIPGMSANMRSESWDKIRKLQDSL